VSKLDEHQKALAKARVDLVKLVDDPSLTVTVDVRVGAPGDEILAAAEEHDADLLVIGTSGNRGVQRWFVGSNAERVVRGSLCDVLVVGARG
jgi:nucleotide-binding universal stress UspA family protein